MSAAVFRDAIEGFFRVRAHFPLLGRSVWCGRALPGTTLGDGQSIRDGARAMRPDIRVAFLRWVTSQGPFLDEVREHLDEDLFFFGSDEVTDYGLGEAARQHLQGRLAGVLSLAASPGGTFGRSPLCVTQGFPSEPINTIDLLNSFDPTHAAEVVARSLPEPTRWQDLLGQCRDRFPGLVISPHCDAVLARFPFEANVARRTVELLGVLQRLVDEIDRGTGKLSAAGTELIQLHFVGDKAWFSDAGNDEKVDFLDEMTFPNPAGGDPITCFWHGKVKTPQYRIHFQWPMPAPYEKLFVAYIGPKISKR